VCSLDVVMLTPAMWLFAVPSLRSAQWGLGGDGLEAALLAEVDVVVGEAGVF
jgi:hypothetical protein